MKSFLRLIFIFGLSCSAHAIEGVGFFCNTYQRGPYPTDWFYTGCQKVIYDANGMPTGVESNSKDIVLANCSYDAKNMFGCDMQIKDKKQYPNFYAYQVEGGAAMPYGEEFFDGAVLNDSELPEGTKLGTMTFCIQGTQYGLENCRKLK